MRYITNTVVKLALGTAICVGLCFVFGKRLYASSQHRAWQQTFENTLRSLPPHAREHIVQEQSRFINLVDALCEEPEIWTILVDKTHPIPADYGPETVVDLSSCAWAHVTRAGLQVSKDIVADLEKMVRAAKLDGVDLIIGSTYRTYAYQEIVHQRLVKQLGVEEARRISAIPGTSQHQLGTVIDFYPIDACFTGTKAQQWLVQHASAYGFSLSFPKGYEAQTGYDYESWHYRYIGHTACQIQNEFFDDLQYLFLFWWHDYKKVYIELLKKRPN